MRKYENTKNQKCKNTKVQKSQKPKMQKYENPKNQTCENTKIRKCAKPKPDKPIEIRKMRKDKNTASMKFIKMMMKLV